MHIESLRPPMLLLSLKADAHLWTAEFNVWKCTIPIGVVGSRHVCATLLSLVWGADSPPPKTEHCLPLLLTNSDACASSKLLSRVLWVQAGGGSQLSGIVGCAGVRVPCMGTGLHVWGPQAYLMASLHASMQLSVQWDGNMVQYRSLQ